MERVIWKRRRRRLSEGLTTAYKSLMAARTLNTSCFVFTTVLLLHDASRETLGPDVSARLHRETTKIKNIYMYKKKKLQMNSTCFCFLGSSEHQHHKQNIFFYFLQILFFKPSNTIAYFLIRLARFSLEFISILAASICPPAQKHSMIITIYGLFAGVWGRL